MARNLQIAKRMYSQILIAKKSTWQLTKKEGLASVLVRSNTVFESVRLERILASVLNFPDAALFCLDSTPAMTFIYERMAGQAHSSRKMRPVARLLLGCAQYAILCGHS